jgi:hypothetical protein
VLQSDVIKHLRDYLDVQEGLINMIWTTPGFVREDHQALYRDYMDEKDDEKTYKVENVVHEFKIIKQVIINNSIPVDLDAL